MYVCMLFASFLAEVFSNCKEFINHVKYCKISQHVVSPEL